MADFDGRLRTSLGQRQAQNTPEGAALGDYLARNEGLLVAAALQQPWRNRGFLESFAAGSPHRARELGLYPSEVNPPRLTADTEGRMGVEAPDLTPDQDAVDFRTFIAAEGVGTVGRLALQIPGGAFDAVQEMGLSVLEFDKAISGMTSLEQLDPALALALREQGLPDPSDPEIMRQLKFKIAPAEGMTEGVARGISQFLTAMIPAAAGFRALGLGSLGAAAAGGAVADLGAFRGLDGNLATLAQEMGFDSELGAFMDSSQAGSEVEAKLLNAVEGMVLGAVIDVTMSGLKGAARGRVTRAQARSFAEAVVAAGRAAKGMVALDENLGRITVPGSPRGQRGALSLSAPISPQRLSEGRSAEPDRGATIHLDTPERGALRGQIVSEALALGNAVTGRKPLAVIVAGGGAAGKGTLVKAMDQAGALPSARVTINADDFKTKLPEYQERLAGGDATAAAVVHEESAALAMDTFDKTITQASDFVLDRTMANRDKGLAMLKSLKDAGYEVRLYGITVDVDTAIGRAKKRGERTGRHVPEEALRQAHVGFSAGFEDLIKLVDEASLYDNSAGTPVEIARVVDGSLTVLDDVQYEKFLSIGASDAKSKSSAKRGGRAKKTGKPDTRNVAGGAGGGG